MDTASPSRAIKIIIIWWGWKFKNGANAMICIPHTSSDMDEFWIIHVVIKHWSLKRWSCDPTFSLKPSCDITHLGDVNECSTNRPPQLPWLLRESSKRCPATNPFPYQDKCWFSWNMAVLMLQWCINVERVRKGSLGRPIILRLKAFSSVEQPSQSRRLLRLFHELT